MSWLQKLKEYAPDILATVATGGTALPAILIKRVSEALGVTITNEKELEQAINASTPEQLLALRVANNQYKLDVMKLELEERKANQQDKQHQHEQTQETIRSGDSALDDAIRTVRPDMAKKSFYAALLYAGVTLSWELFTAIPAHTVGDVLMPHVVGIELFDKDILLTIAAPAWVYMGLRTADKGIQVIKNGKGLTV